MESILNYENAVTRSDLCSRFIQEVEMTELINIDGLLALTFLAEITYLDHYQLQ